MRTESGADELKLILHDAVNQDKVRLNSVLSNGPYDGSRPTMSRSRMARVSALGMCSSFSGTCIGNGKPRCSRVCMSRIFMPVDVDMPRREKSRWHGA